MLKDKCVLLTGGVGGIGREIAKKLLAEGAKVFICDVNSEKLADFCALTGAEGFCCNLLDPDDIKAAADECAKRFGGVDILVNCAGMALNQPFEDTTPEMFYKIFGLNVLAPILLSKHCLPYLEQSSYATILNITSIAAHNAFDGQSLYVASKHALFGFSKCIAQELFEKGVRVHTVAPTGVYTEMISVARPDLKPELMCLPEEIADVVMFILTHRGNSVIDDVMIRRHTKMPWT